MHLLNALGLAWLAIGVPIVLLYLLRMRRREVVISSVLFWERALADMQANAPFQRLRRNLLLFLQLAVVLLGALAVARPFYRTTALGGGTVVAIIDGSASMTAPLGTGTRFTEARRRVADLIARMQRADELMLVLATDRAEVLQPLTSDRRELQRAIAAARPAERPTDLRDALSLAVSVTRARSDVRIYLFSDGAVPPLDDLGLDTAQVELVPCGDAQRNVGITALEQRWTLGERPHAEVLLTLEACGPAAQPREVEVTFHLNDRLFDLQRYPVTPGRPFQKILDNLPASSGLLEVRLSGQDALAADDRAFVSLDTEQRHEVLVVGDAGLFLDKALGVDPRVQAVKTSAAALVKLVAERRWRPGSIAVFCGGTAPAELPLPALLVNAGGPAAPVIPLGADIEQPRIVDWSPAHPVTRDVDFAPVAVAKARRCRPKPWAQAVVESDQGPLVVVGEEAGQRRVWLGFDLLDSDLPLRAGFPILIGNLVSWLGESAERVAVPTVRTGESVTVAVPFSGAGQVVAPDGRKTPVDLGSGRLSYGETDQVGLYRVRSGDRERTFAVSLLSPAETDLTPRTSLKVGRSRVVPPSRQTQRNQELWRPLVCLALLLLLAEWYWYHRRG